ncbi:MAG: NAD(P)-dependent oxidoreductase [Candidatus Thermoplasmatota archaeon]|jgi:NADPH-dependent glutamate synthase beta subunit-like oxidoreductase|nr:NAD(P)-dependent oxidoreductase [Candidatus Thermoplasmatota archaeon]MCL5988173.1 NAD(P)-dependent oxidoreductase [Candidatus Thermoplasmatota archaeon]
MLRFERVKIREEEPEKRLKSFTLEPTIGYSNDEATAEASRCIGCNMCTQACPASLDIGGYINSTAIGDPAQTVRIVFENLPFPAIIGRVCTHNCEDICVMYDTGGPLAIRHLKRYAADKFDDYSKILNVKKRAFLNKKVAVIGAGPAGMSTAYYLAIQGVKVTVFESLPVTGGFMRVGIPRYRLPADVIDKEIQYIQSQGVDIRLNTTVGKDVQFNDIMEEYDSVFLGVGNHKPRMTGTPGSDANNIMHATEFLKRVALGEKINVGKNVIVIGGGFTANDAARISQRLGAKNVYIMYRRRETDRPGYPSMNADEEMEESLDEGINYMWEVTPFEYAKTGETITSIKYWENQMVSDGAGRSKPVPNKEKTFSMDIDFIIEATGQETNFSFLGEDYAKRLKLTPQGHIIVDQNGMTSIPKLFSGGDSTNLTRDLISAVRDGDTAVMGILNYLNLMDRVNEEYLPLLDRWKKFSPLSAKMAYPERIR